MPMMRFTRPLINAGLKMASLGKKIAIGLLIVITVFIAGRIYETQRGPALHPWHTWSADEMSAAEIDRTTFAGYLGREEAIFREMKLELIDTLPDDQKTPLNRFYAQSQVYPQQFQPDWNRSFVLLPEGTPRGAAVLLHGLTDSPYSVRYLANAYQQQGFVAVVPRLPGHGTAPGSLTAVDWQQWMATTRLAVREATRLAGANVPLHVIGYSNGGALALKYALDALDDKALPPPQQIVLLSPMIGVTAFARFAGLTGLPAVFPAFARAAWLNVVPEFNPYKYNSFPVKAARQSWLLTQALQEKIVQDSRSQRLAVCERCRGAHLVTCFQRLGMGDPAHRNLRCPVLGGEKPESRGPGINGAAFNDPAVFTGLGAVEAAGLQPHFLVRDAHCENFVGEVRRVLPVMRYGRLRQFHR